jgi:hypothetical protein
LLGGAGRGAQVCAPVRPCPPWVCERYSESVGPSAGSRAKHGSRAECCNVHNFKFAVDPCGEVYIGQRAQAFWSDGSTIRGSLVAAVIRVKGRANRAVWVCRCTPAVKTRIRRFTLVYSSNRVCGSGRERAPGAARPRRHRLPPRHRLPLELFLIIPLVSVDLSCKADGSASSRVWVYRLSLFRRQPT